MSRLFVMPFGILTLPVIIVLFQGKYQISAELKDKEINNLKEKLKSLQVLRRVTHTQPPLSGSATHASTLPLLPSLSFLPFSFSKTREKKFSKGEVNKGSSCPTKSGAREGRGGGRWSPAGLQTRHPRSDIQPSPRAAAH